MLNFAEDIPVATITTTLYDINQEVHEGPAIPRSQAIVKSPTLLVIHPFLKLDNEEAVVKCHLPKKPANITCVVGISRDREEPVQVIINSENCAIPHDTVLEGMSSGSVRYKLKSSDLPRFIANNSVSTPTESRQGFVATCHNCGTNSKNFRTCDSCLRVIPSDSKIVPDPLCKFSETNTKQLPEVPPAVILNSKMANFQNYSIPKLSRGKATKLPKSRKSQELIVLSSDDESGNPSSEHKKKRKVIVGPAKTVQQEIPSPSQEFLASSNNDTTATMPPSSSQSISESICKTVPPTKIKNNNNINNRSRALSDIPPCSIERANIDVSESSSFERIDANYEPLHETKKQIEEIFSNPEKNDAHFILSCTSIRVGSYVRVYEGDSWKADEFKAKICDQGILFCMAHSVSQSKTMQLVIPKSLIIGCQAYFTIRSSSFIVLRVGNKIARWIKDKLGMAEENKAKSWFDPLNGAPSERNIVLVTDLCSDSQMAILRKIYGKALTELDYQQAAVFRKDIGLELDSDKTDNEILTSGTTVAVVAKPTAGHIKSSTAVTPKPFIAGVIKQNNPVVVTKTLAHAPRGSIARVNNNNGQNPTTKPPTTVTTPTSVPKSDHTPHHYMDGSKAVIKWPKGQGGMTLLQRDILTLMPEQFLNDEIIDFWLSYVLNKLLKKEDKERTHLFSIHFYSRLTQVPKKRNCPAFEMDKKLSAAEKRHRRVKKWTKNVDIFKKDFIIIPIIDNCHWYVAIICFPGLCGPHWMSDDKAISDWTNVLKVNNLPTYQPPPGMPVQQVTKPLSTRVNKPTEPNDIQNEATSSTKDDVGKVVTIGTTITLDQKDNSMIPGMQVRDEAEEDENEDYLFEQYYCSDLVNNTFSKLKSNGLDQNKLNDTNTQLEEIKVTSGAANLTEEPMDVDVELDHIQSSDDSRTDFRVKQPCIILFDSLSGFPRSRVFSTLREYLQQEYKEKIGKERSFSNVDMPGFMPNVPQQNNLCDCGIYALQYVEHFFSHPFPTFCLPITDLQKWFPELKDKRKEIYDTIYELVKTENPETLNRMPKFIEAPATTTTCTSTSTSTPSTSTPSTSTPSTSTPLTSTPSTSTPSTSTPSTSTPSTSTPSTSTPSTSTSVASTSATSTSAASTSATSTSATSTSATSTSAASTSTTSTSPNLSEMNEKCG